MYWILCLDLSLRKCSLELRDVALGFDMSKLWQSHHALEYAVSFYVAMTDEVMLPFRGTICLFPWGFRVMGTGAGVARDNYTGLVN